MKLAQQNMKKSGFLGEQYEPQCDSAFINEEINEESYFIPPELISWMRNEVVFQGLEEDFWIKFYVLESLLKNNSKS